MFHTIKKIFEARVYRRKNYQEICNEKKKERG